MSFMEKTILITGVSRGLGRAMTEEFIRLGHVVIGCGRSEKEIALLQKQFPAPNDFSVVNIADDSQVAAWFLQRCRAYGTGGKAVEDYRSPKRWRGL
jgi:NAD(P)-dependent dehydrogenase (short-subunit alcohol dehydrogenase family)